MVHFTRRGLVAGALLASVLLVATACGDDDDDSGSDTTAAAATSAGGASGGATATSGKIALLLPESKTARYESHDRPLFEAAIKEACAACEIIYSNADQDAAKQQTQAEAALTNGAQVMVLDPVDAKAAAAIVGLAKAKNVPVVSYDRLVSGAVVDFYVSYDNEKVGTLQGQALVDKLKADGKTSGAIVMINGAPTDGNAALFKKGAHSVLDTSGFTVAAESDTVEWSADNAQKDMDGHITKVGKDKIVGVYAANDGTAGGAIAAMKAAGITPLPPVTGQDAELAAIQRILIGDQYLTIYKAINPQAEAAAQATIELLNGDKVSAATSTMNNGAGDIPTLLFDPVSVTATNVKDTVVKDGYWKASDICTSAYAAACTKAGIS